VGDHDRDAAHRLDSPDAHQRYYDTWADTYDEEFTKATGYQAPYEVVRSFDAAATSEDMPIADIGCGTGRLGRELRRPDVDGFDISTGMLEQAARTGVYRTLRHADLTDPSARIEARYGGIISSGTFTIGHLQPRDLTLVLRLGLPDALCCFGINSAHFVEAAFAEELGRLLAGQAIVGLTTREVPSYAVGNPIYDPQEPINRTTIAVFRLAH
jgi:predicted TPR repeat methyltransferase